MPRSPDPAIFVLTTDTTDHFTPCACAWGNWGGGGWGPGVPKIIIYDTGTPDTEGGRTGLTFG